jgi:hypothetical protein
MRKIFLSPTKESRLNGSLLSLLSFDLSGQDFHTHDHSQATRIYLRVASGTLFHSFTNVDEDNGWIQCGTDRVVIQQGQYTAVSLRDAIIAAATGTELRLLTFSGVTGRYSLTTLLPLSGGLRDLMGFDDGAIGFARSANMIRTTNLYIRSTNLVTNNFNTLDGTANTLCTIQVNVPPFEPIFVKTDLDSASVIENAHDLTRLDISITDDAGRLVNFRGISWSLCLFLSTA